MIAVETRTGMLAPGLAARNACATLLAHLTTAVTSQLVSVRVSLG